MSQFPLMAVDIGNARIKLGCFPAAGREPLPEPERTLPLAGDAPQLAELAAWLADLRAADLSGLPPALMVLAGFDILRDEGEAYAVALRAAGTTCRVHREPSLGHGFANLTSVSATAHRGMLIIARDWRTLVAEAMAGRVTA